MDEEKDLASLMLERTHAEERICNINTEHTRLERRIRELAPFIYKKCTHDWDNGDYQIYERTTYRCKLCSSMKK